MDAGRAVLGVSFDYHDAAAALLIDGEPVAAVAEERFSRVKHDPSLPEAAIDWCLSQMGATGAELVGVAFYDKPMAKYERVLSTQARVGPRGAVTLGRAVAEWSRSKLWVGYRLARVLDRAGVGLPPVYYGEHHMSHAASAFHPSPFDEAAIITFDGVGEWATTTIGVGRGSRIELLDELRYPDSLGLLYSSLTAHCGFDVNDGEYKLMGLAPYGDPSFVASLREHFVHLCPDGSIRLNPRAFDFDAGRRMLHPRASEWLGGPARTASEPIGQREADLARSMQVVLEDVVLSVARRAHERTGLSDVCLAGGVALNCVANGRLADDGPFERMWIQPAAGDDGAALGAAFWVWHDVLEVDRTPGADDRMRGALLGPSYGHDEIASWLRGEGIEFDEFQSDDDLVAFVASRLAGGAVLGWFQGAMEFGPRALGNRSILSDPRDPDRVRRINQAVKGREGFRPLAPAVRAEDAHDWFELSTESPFMLRTAQVSSFETVADDDRERRRSTPFAEQLAQTRSAIPACTHVDGSARVQTVSPGTNPLFHSLLGEFGATTGCPVLLNTSFNGPDQPIVRSPADAIECFSSTGLDLLVLGRCVVEHSAMETR